METLEKIFSNREIAYIFWLIVIAIFLLTQNIGKSLVEVLKSFFASKLTLIYIALLIFSFFEVLVIYKLGLWNFDLLKDTIIWFITFSILTLFKSVNIRSLKDFIPIINDIFKLTLFLEFIVNFISFNLLVEIVMLPIITLIGITQIMSKDNKNVFDFLSKLLSVIGLFYLSFSVFKTIKEYQLFTSSENINTLILPVLLSFFSLPFYYFIALYNEYEQIFLRVKFMTKDRKNQNKIKRQIFLNAKLNLHKIAFLRDKLIDFDLFETNDIKMYLNKIKYKK